MPNIYRISVIATILAECTLIAVLIFAGAVSIQAPNAVVSIGALSVAIAVALQVFRESKSTADDFAYVVPIALALSGHVTEAIGASTVGHLLPLLRRALVPHLVVANLANEFTIFIAAAAATNWLTQESTSAPKWLGIAVVAVFVIFLSVELATIVLAVVGGYLSRDAARKTVSLSLRTRLSTAAPLSAIVGYLIGAHGKWMIPALAMPWIVGYSRATMGEELIDAHEMSKVDPLTQLLNRRALYDELDQCTERNFASDDPHWILLCDLDNFKQINDVHGHDAGDHAIVTAANTLAACAGPGDICVRYGGDEFVVLSRASHRPDVEKLGLNICAEIAEHLGFFGVSVSIGIHKIGSFDDPRTAINHADSAMYVSKSQGANRITFSEATQASDRESTARSTTLPEAISEFTTTNFEQAIAYWQSILDTCKDSGDNYGKARALYQLYWISSDTAATDYLAEAMDVGIDSMGWSARAAGAFEARAGNLEAAISHDRRALILARTSSDRTLEILSLMSLGRLLSIMHDHESAIGLVQRAIDIASVHRSHQLALRGYERLIDLMESNLQLPEAVEVSKRCLEYLSRVGATEEHIEAKILAAGVVLQSGDIRGAHALTESAMSEIQNISVSQDLVTRLTAANIQVAGELGKATPRDVTTILEGLSINQDRMGLFASKCGWLQIRFGKDEGGRIDAAIDYCLREAQHVDANYSHELIGAALWLARSGAGANRHDAIDVAASFLETLSYARKTPLLAEAQREVGALEVALSNDLGPLSASIRQWRRFGRRLDELRCTTVGACLATSPVSPFSRADLTDLHTELSRIGLAADSQIVYGLLTADLNTDEATILEILQPCKLLDGLSHAAGVALTADITVENVNRGSEIFDEKAPSDTVWIIMKGTVALSRSTVDGKKLTFALLDALEVLGGGTTSGDLPAGLSAHAVESCVLAGIPMSRIRGLIEDFPTLQTNILSAVSHHLEMMRQFAERVAHWSVRERVAHLLTDLDSRYGHPTLQGHRIINKQISQSQLADMVATSRQTFVLTLGELRKEGVITLRGRNLVITDSGALERNLPPAYLKNRAA